MINSWKTVWREEEDQRKRLRTPLRSANGLVRAGQSESRQTPERSDTSQTLLNISRETKIDDNSSDLILVRNPKPKTQKKLKNKMEKTADPPRGIKLELEPPTEDKESDVNHDKTQTRETPKTLKILDEDKHPTQR